MAGTPVLSPPGAVVVTPAPRRSVRFRDRLGALPSWAWTALAVLALLVAVGLRFAARSPLWLDEAQSIAIAREPLPQLFAALRQDGSPPLYYLLLHSWMGQFGTGNFAVRALSGIFSVIALPLAWLVGRRLTGTRRGAWSALLMLASLPWALRYATEARMYALVVVLVLAGWLALDVLRTRPSRLAFGALALFSGLLTLTHYWAFFLLGALGAVLVLAWRRGTDRAGPWRCLAALTLGQLLFLPWLPSFLYQAAHTGTPWAGRPSPLVLGWVLHWWSAPIRPAPLLLAVLYVPLALAYLWLVVRALRRLPGRPAAPQVVAVAAVLAGTLLAAYVAGVALHGAYESRYTAVAVPVFVALLAAGLTRVRGLPAWRVGTAALVAGGLLVGAVAVFQPRTQAGQVAAALIRHARPGDVVAYCPDQLGPAVSRVLRAPGLVQLGYPTGAGPERIDWVDYGPRNDAASPQAFAGRLIAAAPTRSIWVVQASGYRTFRGDCNGLVWWLDAARPGVRQLVVPDRRKVFEHERLMRWPAPRAPANPQSTPFGPSAAAAEGATPLPSARG